MFGNDLIISADFISDLLSRPDEIADEAYTAQVDQIVYESFDIADTDVDECEAPDGVTYQFYFDGGIEQNGVARAKWEEAEKEHYAKYEEELWQTCDFNK